LEERNGLDPEQMEQMAEKFDLKEPESERGKRLRPYTREELEYKYLTLKKRTCLCHEQSRTVYEAAEFGCVHCCLKYIDQAGKVDEDDEWKCSAMINAVVSNSPDCVIVLLERDAGLKDKNGNTALITAASNGLTECVRMLLDYESGLQDAEGSTALHVAAFNGFTDCVQVLMHKEAGLRKADGCTALMCAAQEGHLECVKCLAIAERGMVDNEQIPAITKTLIKDHKECGLFLWQFEEERNKMSVWAKIEFKSKFGVK